MTRSEAARLMPYERVCFCGATFETRSRLAIVCRRCRRRRDVAAGTARGKDQMYVGRRQALTAAYQEWLHCRYIVRELLGPDANLTSSLSGGGLTIPFH